MLLRDIPKNENAYAQSGSSDPRAPDLAIRREQQRELSSE